MNKIDLKKLQFIVCDFDGVLTDNAVWVNEHGQESVRCCRADGLAVGILKRSGVKIFIISTEKNPVVACRAKKLNVPVLSGIDDKRKALESLVKKYSFSLKNALYIGNDVNDYEAMSVCAWRVCPADAYIEVKKIANIVLKTKGGYGVIRELLGYLEIMEMVKYRNGK